MMPMSEGVSDPTDAESRRRLAELYARLVTRVQEIKQSIPDEEPAPEQVASNTAER
jgi:hypothetical protein